jgi:hypothetical protein
VCARFGCRITRPAARIFIFYAQLIITVRTHAPLLQDNTIPLRSKQLALTTITQLIQLPPRISQLTRCSLLKAQNVFSGSATKDPNPRYDDDDDPQVSPGILRICAPRIHF